MNRRRVKQGGDFFGARVTTKTKALLWSTWRLARLETPGLTVGEMLHHMAVTQGVQLRRRLRKAGIDYSHIEVEKPKFTGPPKKKLPREY